MKYVNKRGFLKLLFNLNQFSSRKVELKIETPHIALLKHFLLTIFLWGCNKSGDYLLCNFGNSL